MLIHLPMIFKNAWRNRRRTILTILSLSVSMGVLGLVMAMYNAFFNSQPAEYEATRLVTRHRVSLTFPLPEFYAQKIKSVKGVKEVAMENWFGGKYIDDRPEHFFAQFATEPEQIFKVRTEMQIPDDQKQAFIQDRAGCVVGREIADKFKWKVGDRLTLIGDIYAFNPELTIRGIYDAPTNNDILYFNRKYMEESLSVARRGNVGVFFILADSKEDVPRVERAVDEMFMNSTAQTKTETESAFALSFAAFLGNIKMFLLIVCAAVTFTILLVSANTIAMSVRERVREVGVLKTLGFTDGTIMGIILFEALVICLIGGAIGVILANGLAALIRSGPAYSEQLKTLSVTPVVVLFSLIMAALIGLVSASIPAWRASRISILEALRNTD